MDNRYRVGLVKGAERPNQVEDRHQIDLDGFYKTIAYCDSEADSRMVADALNTVEKLKSDRDRQMSISSALAAEIEEMHVKEQINCSAAIYKLVNTITEAYSSGHTDRPYLTIQELHRIAQVHIKDNHGVEVLDFTTVFGEDLFNECRAISQKWDTEVEAI